MEEQELPSIKEVLHLYQRKGQETFLISTVYLEEALQNLVALAALARYALIVSSAAERREISIHPFWSYGKARIQVAITGFENGEFRIYFDQKFHLDIEDAMHNYLGLDLFRVLYECLVSYFTFAGVEVKAAKRIIRCAECHMVVSDLADKIHDFNRQEYCDDCYKKIEADLAEEKYQTFMAEALSKFREFLASAKLIPEFTIGKYRVDYYQPKTKIAIELDDPSHKSKINEDNERDRWLFVNHGIVTLRFTYEVITAQYDECCRQISEIIDKTA